jgi:alpha-1,6-mannosyltransferase
MSSRRARRCDRWPESPPSLDQRGGVASGSACPPGVGRHLPVSGPASSPACPIDQRPDVTDTLLDSPTTASRRVRTRARLRALLLGPDRAPVEVAPVEPVVDPQVGRSVIRRYVVLALSTASGFAGSLLIVATVPLWRLDTFSSRLDVPFLPPPDSSFAAGVSFLLGVCLLALGWVGLIGRSERQPWPESRRLLMVVLVMAVWSLPLLFGPPLLSNDAYSYAAQGELASRGIDPTSHGPVYLGGGKFLVAADPVWRNAPAPYGPVAITLSRLAVEVTGHDPAAALFAMRGLAVLGVVMSAVGVGLIARSYRVSPSAAMAIGIANPLVLLHLIGGSHNDALMLGFLALGLAAARSRRLVLAIVLVAAATAVKVPAAAGFVFIGWTWLEGNVAIRRRAARAVAFLAAGAATVGLLCLVAGTGLTWVANLRGTGSVKSTFSITTRLGFVLSDALNGIGLSVDEESVISLTRLAGLAAAGLISLIVLLRSPQLGLVRSLGLVMVAVIVLGPVVWPWYLPTGFALLAAAGLGKYRPSYLVGVFAVSLLVFPTSVEGIPDLNRYQHVLAVGVVALIAAACYGAQRVADQMHERRLRQRSLAFDDLQGPIERSVLPEAEPLVGAVTTASDRA